MIEGRLTTILRRTKTSGPNRQVKERMASYGDAMVATAGLLSAMNLQALVQGHWTRTDRFCLQGLSLLETPPTDKDILGMWKPEGSENYARCYGGRVARLQATFPGAVEGRITMRTSTRGRSLVASVEKDKLDVPQATQLTQKLAISGGGPWLSC